MRTLIFLVAAGLAIAGPAAAQQVTVSDRECRQLVEYVASQDVNYKPGVDVYGRRVAPADTAGSMQIAPPQNFTFDVGVDLRRFGIPNSSPLFQPNVSVGKVTVEDGGRRLSFNGQPLGNSEQQALAELCRQRQQGRR